MLADVGGDVRLTLRDLIQSLHRQLRQDGLPGLGLEPVVLQTTESGVELVQIDVGSFRSLLLRNPTTTTFTLVYGVNDPGRPGGVGSAFCEAYSVMSGLFNSRDAELEGLEFIIEARPAPVRGCD